MHHVQGQLRGHGGLHLQLAGDPAEQDRADEGAVRWARERQEVPPEAVRRDRGGRLHLRQAQIVRHVD